MKLFMIQFAYQCAWHLIICPLFPPFYTSTLTKQNVFILFSWSTTLSIYCTCFLRINYWMHELFYKMEFFTRYFAYLCVWLFVIGISPDFLFVMFFFNFNKANCYNLPSRSTTLMHLLNMFFSIPK